jgi:hypothetical protein
MNIFEVRQTVWKLNLPLKHQLRIPVSQSLTHNVFSQKHRVMVWLSRQTDVGPPKLDGAIFREGT